MLPVYEVWNGLIIFVNRDGAGIDVEIIFPSRDSDESKPPVGLAGFVTCFRFHILGIITHLE